MCVVKEFRKGRPKDADARIIYIEAILRVLPKEYIPLVEGFIKGIIDSTDICKGLGE